MPLETDFNTSPYFDDFDENKKFYRILFRPTVAVQARELTQLQTMLQNQIDKFGNRILTDGSIISGCSPTTIKSFDFVRVVDNFTANANGVFTAVNNQCLLVGQTSNVRAVALVTTAGLEVNYPDTNHFHVKYLNTGVNGNTTFANGELIRIYNENQSKLGAIDSNNFINSIYVISTNATINAIGKGYGLTIEEGWCFQKGFFQKVDGQTIVVNEYETNVANYVVGFETTESIVTETEDESLLDNALGYSNENAPGAHRLKLTPTITSRLRTDIANNESFFIVFEFSNITNDIVINRSDDPYSKLGDYVNDRTFEESGDYVVKPFQVESTYPTNLANTDAFAYEVSTGTGYVHGKRVNFESSLKIDTNKAITTREANSQVITTNYGNFVYANEVMGALDFSNFITVDLYDTQQSTISVGVADYTLNGNKIGSAKVKQVVHDEGDPGLPGTTYRIYLTDISMNSGKSFMNDAKAIVANSSINTYGEFRADLANSTTTAILNQSGRTNLVFPFGKKALRTLRSSNGSVNATEFYFRATSTANLSNLGILSVTSNSSYTGGSDTLGYSGSYPFQLGDTLENEFIVTFKANATTINVGGSFGVSSNTTLTGTGITNYFANGEYIKIFHSGGTVDYRRVVSTNSTVMTLDANVAFTNASANVAKFYPVGYEVPLDATYPGSRYVNITSTTTFDISTGSANSTLPMTSSTTAMTVQYKMRRSQATQAKKDVKKNRYVKLNLANNSGGYNGPWSLGLPDVIKLRNVWGSANASYSNTTAENITRYFVFTSGQKDDYYDHGSIVLRPEYRGYLSSIPYLTVEVDHFTANLNNGVGFFSVDSYPTTNSTVTNTTISWAEIPTYTTGNITYDLRDSVDFRAYKSNTANSSTTMGGATVNPSTTNTFVSGTFSYLSEPDSNFQADIEYFLGRMDLVTISQQGQLGVIQGVPSEDPKAPNPDVDSMVIAAANVAPFPTLNARELETYKRRDLSVRTSLFSNRVYTMKDIGQLDQRIKRLEYYTTLNQLEQKAQNIQVPDATTNLNRFKNGIFADPMTSHIFAQANDEGYRWCIDIRQGHGRPTFTSKDIDLSYNNTTSTGVTLTGKLVTRPYSHEQYIFQPYATKYRNNNQDIWTWNGTLNLYPNYDMNKDEQSIPNADAVIDLMQPFVELGEAGNIWGSHYGPWQVYAQSGNVYSGLWTYWQQLVTTHWYVPMTNTVELGRFLTDIAVQPYIKSKTIAFIATGVKPSSRMYAYFDETPVSTYCAPGSLNTSLGNTASIIVSAAARTGRPDTAVTRTGNFGDPIYSDQFGNVFGVFNIPEGQFRVGERRFMVMDADSLVYGDDAALSKAVGTYVASNITTTSQEATITTITPDVRTCYSYNYMTTYFRDPIAQSFKVESPQQESGVFATKVDLFFKSKSQTDGIRVVVCGMVAGLPDNNKVFGWGRIDANNVNVSDTANSATTISFNEPIYLSGNTEYAFWVEPESSTPDYNMWVAEMGDFDVTTGSQIGSNPYTGESFRSSNARTWTALPREDVKFNLYVANFTVGTGQAYFNNENDEYITYSSIALANSLVTPSSSGGDEVYVINASSNAIINTPATIHGSLQYIDLANNQLILDSSTGSFSASQKIGFFRFRTAGNTAEASANVNTLIATANIVSIDDYAYHAIVPRFSTITPLGTAITTAFVGSTNSGIADTNYNALEYDIEREMLDYERVIYSRSNEPGILGANNKSLTIKNELTCVQKYVSPAIDISRKGAKVINNTINFNTFGEDTGNGNSLCRYISQPIVLADGQDSEDMKIYLSAYRPYNTDVEVYVKFLSSSDPQSLVDKDWTKLNNESSSVYCSPIDRYDFREYVYSVPTSVGYSSYNVTANTTGVSNTNETIAIEAASSIFNVGDKVYYAVPAGNTAIGGLTANSYYYVSFSNSSAIAVANTPGGANVNITESRTGAGEVHTMTGPVVHRAFANASNFGVIEYSSETGARYTDYKTFAIKIVLLSTSGVFVPKVDDLRGIALMV